MAWNHHFNYVIHKLATTFFVNQNMIVKHLQLVNITCSGFSEVSRHVVRWALGVSAPPSCNKWLVPRPPHPSRSQRGRRKDNPIFYSHPIDYNTFAVKVIGNNPVVSTWNWYAMKIDFSFRFLQPSCNVLCLASYCWVVGDKIATSTTTLENKMP